MAKKRGNSPKQKEPIAPPVQTEAKAQVSKKIVDTSEPFTLEGTAAEAFTEETTIPITPVNPRVTEEMILAEETAKKEAEEQPGKEQPADEVAETGKEVNPLESELIMGKYKSQDDLINAYKEIQASKTRGDQEKAEQEKFYKDLLAQTAKKQEEKAPELNYKELADLQITDPAEYTRRLSAEITRQVKVERDKEVAEKAKVDEQNDLTTAQAEIIRLHPEIVKEENYPILNAYANQSDKPNWSGRFEDAVKEFKAMQERLKAEVTPSVQETVAQTEQMKANAKIESSTARSTAKIYKMSDIRRLITENPAEYQRLQPEIMKAYSENRVR